MTIEAGVAYPCLRCGGCRDRRQRVHYYKLIAYKHDTTANFAWRWVSSGLQTCCVFKVKGAEGKTLTFFALGSEKSFFN